MKQKTIDRRQPAQVIVLFAIALIAMLAMLGVAVDGGTLYVQRRTAQNAADAAALAGARAMQKATTSPTGAIPAEICKYVLANNFGVTPTISAYFVDVNGAKVAGGDIGLPAHCQGTTGTTSVWAGVAGVHVDVTMGPYNTYLVGLVGLRQLSASGGATAQVWDYAINANDIGPWAVCGHSAPYNTDGDLTDILNPDNTVKQSAIDHNVKIILESAKMDASQSDQSWLPMPPACPDNSGSSWKGLIDPGSGIIILPDNADTVNGNADVDAPCTATGQNINTSCYLWVPVTDAHNTPGWAHIVTFICMQITQGQNGNEKWWGTVEPGAACPTYPYQPVWTWGNGTTNTIVAMTR